MVPQNCSVSHILQNIFLCVQQNKDIHTGWNYQRVSKWWQNFHFWVNYPFKGQFPLVVILLWTSVEDWHGREEIVERFFFLAHKNNSRSFIKLRLNHWCHMDYFNDVLTTFLSLESVSCIAVSDIFNDISKPGSMKKYQKEYAVRKCYSLLFHAWWKQPCFQDMS